MSKPQKSKAPTVPAYLKSLPEPRRKALHAVRKIMLKNLPRGLQETMNWGVICYEVPLKTYPNTYNGKPLCFAALASQKNYMAIYLMSVYADKRKETWFREEYRASGKKLNMGKSCVRFKKLEDLPLELIAKVMRSTSVNTFLRGYESVRKKD
jgi:hypothetical protein